MNFIDKIRAATAKAKLTAEADGAIAKASELLPDIEAIAKAATDEMAALQTALTERDAKITALETANAGLTERIGAIETARTAEAAVAKAAGDELLTKIDALKAELVGLIDAAKTAGVDAAKTEADTVAKAKIDEWVTEFAPRGGRSQGRVDDLAISKGKDQPEGDKAVTSAFAALPGGAK